MLVKVIVSLMSKIVALVVKLAVTAAIVVITTLPDIGAVQPPSVLVATTVNVPVSP